MGQHSPAHPRMVVRSPLTQSRFLFLRRPRPAERRWSSTTRSSPQPVHHSPQPPYDAGNSTPAPTSPTPSAPLAPSDAAHQSPDTRPCSPRWSIKPARVRARGGDSRLLSPIVPCNAVRQTATYRPRLSRSTLPAAAPRGSGCRRPPNPSCLRRFAAAQHRINMVYAHRSSR